MGPKVEIAAYQMGKLKTLINSYFWAKIFRILKNLYNLITAVISEEKADKAHSIIKLFPLALIKLFRELRDMT